jgi:phosphoribosylaminoimidazole-succinocarboxamide synthase
MIDVETIRAALDRPLLTTSFDRLGRKEVGKVRDNYVTDDGRRYLVTTDRVSAFDRVLGALPLKGQVLQHASSFWFERTAHIAPNHLVRTLDPNVIEALECTPLRVEMVVRAYLTGVTSTSIWTHYQQGKREFCGHRLPDGLRKNEPLPSPLITPSSKGLDGQHDVSMSRAELTAAGLVTAADFDAAAELCMALFRFGQQLCAERGLILVDTKYELGRDATGTLRVIDEMHTPDSSRFWRAESYAQRMAEGAEPESFDKEYLRRWLVDHGYRGEGPPPAIPDEVRVEAARRYIEACQAITGSTFAPDLDEPVARMTRNLGLVPSGA